MRVMPGVCPRTTIPDGVFVIATSINASDAKCDFEKCALADAAPRSDRVVDQGARSPSQSAYVSQNSCVSGNS